MLILGGATQALGRRLSLPLLFMRSVQGSVQNMNADPVQVKQMLNEALLKLTSAQDIGTAWTRLGITPAGCRRHQDQHDGRARTLPRITLSSMPFVMGFRLRSVPRTQMIIWDKFQNKMTPAGYGLRRDATLSSCRYRLDHSQQLL